MPLSSVEDSKIAINPTLSRVLIPVKTRPRLFVYILFNFASSKSFGKCFRTPLNFSIQKFFTYNSSVTRTLLDEANLQTWLISNGMVMKTMQTKSYYCLRVWTVEEQRTSHTYKLYISLYLA